MNLDKHLKDVIAWNASAYRHLYSYIRSLPSGLPERQVAQDVCTIGFKKNFYLAKDLSEIQLVAGDDEAAEVERGFVTTQEDKPQLQLLLNAGPSAPKVDKEAEKEKRDLEELEKLFKLEYDEKESQRVKENASNTTNGEITNSESHNPETIAPNWYDHVFKPRFPAQGAESEGSD